MECVVITKEMLAAGVEQFCEFDPDAGEPIREVVARIFSAMSAAKLPCADVSPNLIDDVRQPEEGGS